MRHPLSVLTFDELGRYRTAASEAISAMAWYDIMIADVKGLKQSGSEWSYAAEAIRKIDAEIKRRHMAEERQA